MPGTTPIYGFPYQTLSDSPHGPNLGQQLATEVETELNRVEDHIGNPWTSYVPVFAAEGGTPAVSLAQGGWIGLGRWVTFWARVVISNAGTGRWTLTFPRTAARAFCPGIAGHFLDLSAVGVWPITAINFSTAAFRMATAPSGFLSQTNPVVTGVGDEIVIGGTYEAATDAP